MSDESSDNFWRVHLIDGRPLTDFDIQEEGETERSSRQDAWLRALSYVKYIEKYGMDVEGRVQEWRSANGTERAVNTSVDLVNDKTEVVVVTRVHYSEDSFVRTEQLDAEPVRWKVLSIGEQSAKNLISPSGNPVFYSLEKAEGVAEHFIRKGDFDSKDFLGRRLVGGEIEVTFAVGNSRGERFEKTIRIPDLLRWELDALWDNRREWGNAKSDRKAMEDYIPDSMYPLQVPPEKLDEVSMELQEIFRASPSWSTAARARSWTSAAQARKDVERALRLILGTYYSGFGNIQYQISRKDGGETERASFVEADLRESFGITFPDPGEEEMEP